MQCVTSNAPCVPSNELVFELMRKNIMSRHLSIFQLHTLIYHSQVFSLHPASNVHFFSCLSAFFLHLWKDLANPKYRWTLPPGRNKLNLYGSYGRVGHMPPPPAIEMFLLLTISLCFNICFVLFM